MEGRFETFLCKKLPFGLNFWGVFVIYIYTNIYLMKYAILIESKNWRFAALERIAQIINPSVNLKTFSFNDIKLRDIFITVLCPLLSLDPLSSHITNAEGFGESGFFTISFECSEPIAINYSLAESLASKYRLRFLFLQQRDGYFQVINLHTGTIRALPAEPFYLNRALMWAGLDFAQLKPHDFEDDWAVASTILQEWKFLYRHFPLMK